MLYKNITWDENIKGSHVQCHQCQKGASKVKGKFRILTYHYTSGLRKLNLLISILKLSAEQIGWAVSEAITDDGKTEEEYIADY